MEKSLVLGSENPPLKQWVLGKFSPDDYSDFVNVPNQYVIPGKSYTFHSLALEAFIDMHNAAQADGVSLLMISAFRNFTYQSGIWNTKYNNAVDSGNFADGYSIDKYILLYSAMPGSSRHHWGTDVDINSVEDSYFLVEPGKSEYAWLVKNGRRFGFCQTYDKKDPLYRTKGYEEEKWHWSFMPVSKMLLYAYGQLVNYSEITGFEGSEYAQQINIIPDYVFSIHRQCLDWPQQEEASKSEITNETE